MRRRFRPQRLLLGVTALVLLLGGAYFYATRPARLRAGLVHVLRTSGFGDVRMGDVSFSLRRGLEVVGLEADLTAPSNVTPGTNRPPLPPLLSVAYVQVRCDLAALLLGRFRPTELVLRGAAVALVRDADSGAANWLPSGGGGMTVRPGSAGDYPRLRIERADVQFLRVQAGRPRLVRRLVVDAAGVPEALPEDPGTWAYQLRVTQAGAADALPLAELRLGPGKSWRATADWTDLETLALLLPRSLARVCQDVNLTGRVRVERVGGRRGAVSEVGLQLAGLSLSLPVEDAVRQVPREERFLRVENADASITYRCPSFPAGRRGSSPGGRLRVRAVGQIAGAAGRLTFSADGLDLAALISDLERATGGGTALPLRQYEAELRVESLALPTAAQQPAFVSSRRLPGPVRNLLEKYDPQGRVNLWLTARGTRAPTGRAESAAGEAASPSAEPVGRWRTEFEGVLEALGASCRYFEFPYLVEDVRGRVRFSGGSVYLEGLRGRHGTARISADGRIYTTKSWSGLDLTFRGTNVALNGDLYAALPARYAGLWDTTMPIGLCDARVTIHRGEGSARTGPLKAETRVEARLLSGSLSVSEDRRLDHADALISIERGLVTVRDLYGHFGDATLRLAGAVETGDEAGAPRPDVRIEAVGVPLRRSNDIRDAEGESLGTVQLCGIGDIWGRVGGGSDERGGTSYAVRLREGELLGFDPARPWQHAQGWIALQPGRQQIRALAARRDDAWLEVAGTLPTQMVPSGLVDLNIRAGSGSIQSLLRQVVPARWARVREALGLGGAGELSVRFRPQALGGAASRLTADVRLSADRMKPELLPLDLNTVQARLSLWAGGLELREATARYRENGRISVSGRAGWEAGSAWSDVRVNAEGLEFSDDLIDAMPAPLADLLRRMRPKGRVNAVLDRVRMTGGGDRNWQIAGRLLFEHAELRLGLPLTDFEGELSGTCRVDSRGQVALQADFVVERGQLAGRDIQRWEGVLSREAGERWVGIKDVRGRLCDGEIIGRGRVDPASGAYELSLTLHDLSLDQFLRKPGAQPGTRPGRIDGRVFLRGAAGDGATRRGGGELRIRGASLLGTPVLASVAEATRRANRKVGDALETVELRFVWEGWELEFVRVDIRAPDLRLVGEGRWDLRSDALAMTLVGAHPDRWPRVAVLSDLIEVAGQELLQYRVAGTAADPRVTVEPLHNLTEPLRKLLGESD